MKAVHRVILIAVVCVAGLKSNAQSVAFLTNGLVAYYAFDGNANDTSGNGNDGTPNNITYVADRFGNPNAAASFAGNSSSYVAINTTNLNLNPEFSVSVWIEFQPGQGFEGPRIFSTAGYEITTDLNPNARYVNFDFTGDSGGTYIKSLNPVPAGVWNHIVGVFTTNQLILYANGVFAGSVSNNIPPSYNRGFLPTIGVNSGAHGNDNYAGLIDDLGIYNRALSPLEVAEIYQSSLLAGIVAVPGIVVAGNSNQVFSIQYVTSLSSTNWTTLVSNIVLQSNSYIYPDTSAVGQPQRFYRVVCQ